MSEENSPQKERYLREVEQKLLHRELDARLLEEGLVHVRWHEKPLCSVDIKSRSEKTHPYRITSALLHEWAANWSDVIEFIPVISSREMREKMAHHPSYHTSVSWNFGILRSIFQ